MTWIYPRSTHWHLSDYIIIIQRDIMGWEATTEAMHLCTERSTGRTYTKMEENMKDWDSNNSEKEIDEK